MKYLRRALLLLLACFWSLLAYLTHTPHLPPIGQQMSDKLEHFLAYGALTGLLFLTLWAYKRRMPFLPVVVYIIVMAYGAVDEWTQPYFGRTCDFRDWLADGTGAIIAVIVLGFLRLYLQRRFPDSPSPQA